MTVKEQVVHAIMDFRINHAAHPSLICMSRSQFHELLKEDSCLLPSIHFSADKPTIFGIRIVLGDIDCYCGEKWDEDHKCLPSLVNGPPPFIRIV